MLYLSIESSCDETSLALLECSDKSFYSDNLVTCLNSLVVKSSIVSSQIAVHAQYGGVIPEIGARLHAEQIHFIFNQMLEKASLEIENLRDLDTIFVTTDPGLMSALRVGIEFAKSIQFFLQKKFDKTIEINSVNHLRGHVASCFYHPKSSADDDIYPHLHLLVSGGNSQIILLKSWNDWSVVGKTLDDAAGETLDKIARMMGIDYPGGATIAKIAGIVEENRCNLPLSMKGDSLDYSFSGLKTSVRYLIQKQSIDDLEFEKKLSFDELESLIKHQASKNKLNKKLQLLLDICVSAQFVVIEQLIRKLSLGVREYLPKSLGVSGGVSANQLLRKKVQGLAIKNHINQVFIPQISLTGDNAVMIGLAGVAELLK